MKCHIGSRLPGDHPGFGVVLFSIDRVSHLSSPYVSAIPARCTLEKNGRPLILRYISAEHN